MSLAEAGHQMGKSILIDTGTRLQLHQLPPIIMGRVDKLDLLFCTKKINLMNGQYSYPLTNVATEIQP